MSKRKDISGMKFGRLLALEDAGRADSFGNCRLWKCRCECGTEKIIPLGSLTTGNSRSCGCLATEGKRNRLRLPEGEAIFNGLLYDCKRSAARRNLSFELSVSQFRELITSNCFYCGSSPATFSFKKKNKNRWSESNGGFIHNGIDRADNNLGYTIENSLPCCPDCNYLKSSRSKEEFIALISRIYTHLTK